MTRPLREEQQPASDEITAVAAGVLRLQLPIRMPGLGHVNCYALEDERGFAVVDPGLPGPRSWRNLTTRLGQAGIPTSRIHTVIVTHSHPDHFGGAGHLRKQSGARIVSHRTFRTWFDPNERDGADDEEPEAAAAAATDGRPPWERPAPWGGKGPSPGRRRMFIFSVISKYPRLFGTPTPTQRLEDAEVIRLGRRDWVAMHTPGHTADHLCLFDPVEGILLSGDHVLPTITPHIGGLGGGPDPLTDFFASLDRVAQLEGVPLALPAHGHPFTDLTGRVKAIHEHHEQRLEKLRAAAVEVGEPTTVPELSKHLFSPRAWGPMADSETFAHLEHLRLAGEVTRTTNDGQFFYALAG
jgi:glyoxylase-like metal-dependent hydrolase (beta-lactamase superfamily II)